MPSASYQQKGLSVSEDGTVVTYSGTRHDVANNKDIYFPTVNVAEGYEKIDTNKQNSSYWQENGAAKKLRNKTVSWHPDKDGYYYELVAMPVERIRVTVNYVKAGSQELIYSSGMKFLNFNKTLKLDSYTAAAEELLAGSGYALTDAQKNLKAVYSAANTVKLLNAFDEEVAQAVKESQDGIDYTLTVEVPEIPKVTADVTFESNPVNGGKIKCFEDGDFTVRFKSTLTAGEAIDLPEVEASDNYTFEKWIDGNGNDLPLTAEGKYVVDENITLIRAQFAPKTISIRFEVLDPESAVLSKSGVHLKYASLSDDKLSVTVEGAYYYTANNDVTFPSATINKGYKSISTGTTGSYWVDRDTGDTYSRSSKIKFDNAYNGKVYQLVTVPVSSRTYYVRFVDDQGNQIYKTGATQTVKFDAEPRELLLKYMIDEVVKKDYEVSEDWQNATVRYINANRLLVTRSGEDTELKQLDGGIFTIDVPVKQAEKFNITETIGSEETIKQVKSGENYELDLGAIEIPEGKVISRVLVDGNEVTLTDGKVILENVTADHTVNVVLADQEAVKTTISFDFTSGGSSSIRKTYKDVEEGTEVAVPEPTPLDGYEFTGWTDAQGNKVELGTTVKATKENQSYKANFIGKEITVTWKATVPGVVSWTLPSGSKGKDMTVLEDGSVQLKTRYSSSKRTVYFPTPKITDDVNYETSISISGGRSHWSHGETTISWTNFTLKHTDDGDSYTLVVMPKSLRYYDINYVNEAGETVYSPYTKVNYQSTNAVSQSYTQKKLEELGYEMTGNWAEASVVYDKAGLLEIRDKDGNVLQTAVQKENKPTEQLFTIPVQKSRFSISTSVGDGEASVTPVKRGETFELNVNELEIPEGKVISRVLVDGSEVTLTDGKVILENVLADHTVNAVLVDAELDLDVLFTHSADGLQHQKTISLAWNEKTPAVIDDDHGILADKGYAIVHEGGYLHYDADGHISILDADGNQTGELKKKLTRSASGIQHEIEVKKLYTISHDENPNAVIEYPTYESELHPSAAAKGYNAVEGHRHSVKVTPADGYILKQLTVNGQAVSADPAGAVLEITGDGQDLHLKAEVLKKVTVTFGNETVEGVEGDEIVIPAGADKDGWTFTGWKDENGVFYPVNSTLVLGDSDLVMIEVYERKPDSGSNNNSGNNNNSGSKDQDKSSDDKKKTDGANTAVSAGLIPAAAGIAAGLIGILSLLRKRRQR